MPMTPLPTPPSTSDPATFAARADAWLIALLLFQTEANALSSSAITLSGGVLTGTLGFVAGSVGAPSLFATGDTNTGLWSPAADTLAFSAGGSEVLRFGSAFGFGIGLGINGTPTVPLEIFKNATGISFASIKNQNVANDAGAGWRLDNGSGTFSHLKLLGASFFTSGIYKADGTVLEAGGTGGLTLNTLTAQNLVFAVNGTVAYQIDTAQMFRFAAPSMIANNTVATVLGSLGPTGSHTTVQEWLQVKNASGTIRYIPMF